MRNIPTWVVILATTLLQRAYAVTPEYQIAREKDVTVAVSVVDGDGHPVPYAEVWRVVTPTLRRQDQFARRPRYELSLDYLNRAIERNKDCAEFAGPWRPGFWRALVDATSTQGQFSRLVPTSDSGETTEILKVERDRPAAIAVRYAALSYGYQPALVDRTIAPSEHQVSLRIVLRRASPTTFDPAVTKAFGELRLGATPESPSYKGEGRMDEERTQLLALAASAQAAGDKATAARIYGWVPFVPTRMMFDNTSASGMRVSGYEREDEKSDRNLALVNKAAALDPANRYLRMKRLLLAPPAEAKDQLEQLEGLLSGGNDVWPEVYLLLEGVYGRLHRPDDARRTLERYVAVEPEDVQNWPEYRKLRFARYATLEEFRDQYVVAGDVNKEDIYGRAPMLYAVHAGRVDLFVWLVTQGAKTPLDSWAGVQALISGNPAMVRHLLEAEPAVVGRNALQQLRNRPELLANQRKSPWADKEALDEIDRLIRP